MVAKSFFRWSFVFSPASGAIIEQFSNPHRLTGSSFGISGVNATYDYVIIGGGIAGSVVANRLSVKNVSVALVEAGSFYELTNGNWSQVPFWSEEGIGAGLYDWQPHVDWGLVTEPQINGRRYHYAQGKTLGGSSARNQMLYHWPTKGSLDVWAEQVGDDSYRWENMVKYLQRSVQFSPNNHRESNEPKQQASTGNGPLQVTLPAYVNALSAHGPEAFSSLGLQERSSLTNGSLEGYGWWHFTMDPATGLRSSAESSFLSQALSRPDSGLMIYINAHARQILFDNKTATGVVVTTNDNKRPFTLTASKEVILAAGAHHSPQLLMVSGIGDKTTLDPLSIPLVHHLPGVGQNMKDSCYLAGPVYEVSTPGPSYWREPGQMRNATEEFLYNASGPLTSIGLDLAVWDRLPEDERASLSDEAQKAVNAFPDDWPLIEYSLSSSNRVPHLFQTDSEKHYGTIDCVLVAASSKGNMTIKSPSNLDPPILNPNWLQSRPDQAMAVKAYKRAREAWKAIPKDIRLGEELFPGPGVTTDEEIVEAIKGAMGPIHHATGSCAMGRHDDPNAVVDSKGRVYGVEKVRVVDSSSFPFTPPGHTQAVTYALAEKLVEDILEGLESDDERLDRGIDRTKADAVHSDL